MIKILIKIILLFCLWPVHVIKALCSDTKKAKSNRSKKVYKEYQRKSINKINPDWVFTFKQTVKNANSMGTDLIEMSEHYPTCAECAKYQGRVYSISGASRKYPPLPDCIAKNGQVHKNCKHDFYPFIDGYSGTYHKDIVKYSNSPFVDNRTPDEIREYESEIAEVKAKKQDKKEYDLILEKLPDIAPKSFGGYRKMKKSSSKNFQKLSEKCKKVGIKIK